MLAVILILLALSHLLVYQLGCGAGRRFQGRVHRRRRTRATITSFVRTALESATPSSDEQLRVAK